MRPPTGGRAAPSLTGPRGRVDPRLYQIACLAGLLLWGMTSLGLDQTPGRVVLLVVACLVTQAVGGRLRGARPWFEPKSALISALSLCLLLRAADPPWLVAGAVLAIGSKFVLRWRGKHVFNPTNFGLVALLSLGAPVWVSPGQWGHAGTSAFLFACLGLLVVTRAARADVTFAFLFAYAAVLFGRAAWLGQPWSVPSHQMASGALLLFSFFMISDPKTTPDARAGRVLFGVLVALGAGFVQFVLYRTNGLLWSLAAFSVLVPLIDRLVAGPRYAWRLPSPHPEEDSMRSTLPRTAAAVMAFTLILAARPAAAFCGFFVAQADAKLFNESSQVVLARDGDRTVVTMANDFEGPVEEFAIVVPVPTVLEKDQVHIGDARLIGRIDAFSAPRLVEYHDPPPCPDAIAKDESRRTWGAMKMALARGSVAAPEAASGVTIEARYTVGEYDILILSARQSSGLRDWLTQNGYRIPAGANRILDVYIRQGLKFFVARVNLGEQRKLGVKKLRPIQIAYESPRFMLPIRLGLANAKGTQELFVYTLTPRGRVETVNYRTTKLPSDVEVPLFVKQAFADFYRALFREHVRKTGMDAVTLEYAWNAATCDPCAAPPLAHEELRELGVSWLSERRSADVFVTRLHVRYDQAHFPEDLVFQETANAENFQGRYVLRHPWKGTIECAEGGRYREELARRRREQRANVVELTGWSDASVGRRMARGDDAYLPAVASPKPEATWWQRLWPK